MEMSRFASEAIVSLKCKFRAELKLRRCGRDLEIGLRTVLECLDEVGVGSSTNVQCSSPPTCSQLLAQHSPWI